MTNALTIPPDVFSTKGIGDVPGFAALVTTCILQSGTIAAELGNKEIRLTLLPRDAETGISLEGRWRRPFIAPSGPAPVGARLLLPLMFRASRVLLSWRRITTLGREYRPVADFLARNLFGALLVNAPVEFRETSLELPIHAGNMGLLNHYYYISRAQFPEPLLHQTPIPEAMDLLVANSVLPVVKIDNPLLRLGFDHLRRHRPRAEDSAERKSAFLDVRQAMLAHYPN